MKKIYLLLSLVAIVFISGCDITIDYSGVNNEENNSSSNQNDETNNEVKLTIVSESKDIDNSLFSYPSTSYEDLINKYTFVYEGVSDNYEIYSSYYSSFSKTLFIAYNKKNTTMQQLKSKDLAIINEHALYYFDSSLDKKDYIDYLSVVRIYPDYASSACRNESHSEQAYSQIGGCANYDQISASINLNALTNLDNFFNKIAVEGSSNSYYEPIRDTFAHEFGHVSTYYNMILKGDGNYLDYLNIRLNNRVDELYSEGLPKDYSYNYYMQPVEILADDYVELYYNLSSKHSDDLNDYELEYNDIRSSLSECEDLRYLKNDNDLKDRVKEYYGKFINNNYQSFSEKKVYSTKTNVALYQTIQDISNSKVFKNVSDSIVVGLGSVKVNNINYIRVVIKNYVSEVKSFQDYGENICYVKESDLIENSEYSALHISKYNNEFIQTNTYYNSEAPYIFAHYDFAYFLIKGNEEKAFIFNYVDGNEFRVSDFNKNNFI